MERPLELEQAGVKLQSALDKQLEFDKLEPQFFQNTSHELRTPLTLILAPLVAGHSHLVRNASSTWLSATSKPALEGTGQRPYRGSAFPRGSQRHRYRHSRKRTGERLRPLPSSGRLRRQARRRHRHRACPRSRDDDVALRSRPRGNARDAGSTFTIDLPVPIDAYPPIESCATKTFRSRSELPRAIISDVMMRGLSEHDLVRALRSHSRTKSVPVILITADADVQRRAQGIEAGADDYPTKRFEFQELRARTGWTRARAHRLVVHKWKTGRSEEARRLAPTSSVPKSCEWTRRTRPTRRRSPARSACDARSPRARRL